SATRGLGTSPRPEIEETPIEEIPHRARLRALRSTEELVGRMHAAGLPTLKPLKKGTVFVRYCVTSGKNQLSPDACPLFQHHVGWAPPGEPTAAHPKPTTPTGAPRPRLPRPPLHRRHSFRIPSGRPPAARASSPRRASRPSKSDRFAEGRVVRGGRQAR